MNSTLGTRWRKSSYSDHAGGDCVEAADLAPLIGIRDSKDPDGPKLTLTPAAWSTFVRDLKNGENDLA